MKCISKDHKTLIKTKKIHNVCRKQNKQAGQIEDVQTANTALVYMIQIDPQSLIFK